LLKIDRIRARFAAARFARRHRGARLPAVRGYLLTDPQIAALRVTIARQLGFLSRLRQRMDRLGFEPDDQLYRATIHAFNGMQELHVVTLYLKHGVKEQPNAAMGQQIIVEL
jgi:hypothetical protein